MWMRIRRFPPRKRTSRTCRSTAPSSSNCSRRSSSSPSGGGSPAGRDRRQGWASAGSPPPAGAGRSSAGQPPTRRRSAGLPRGTRTVRRGSRTPGAASCGTARSCRSARASAAPVRRHGARRRSRSLPRAGGTSAPGMRMRSVSVTPPFSPPTSLASKIRAQRAGPVARLHLRGAADERDIKGDRRRGLRASPAARHPRGPGARRAQPRTSGDGLRRLSPGSRRP